MKKLARTSPGGFIFIVGIGILLFHSVAYAGPDTSVRGKKSLAEQCASDLGAVRERIFANPGGQTWNEYSTMKQVSRLDGDHGEMTVTVKTSSSGRHFVRFIEYGEDNARFQANCYDGDGRLLASHYEMRTAWGWGYEEKRTFSPKNKELGKSVRYFDLKSNQAIKRPVQAGDVPDFTKPSIYKNFASLPIAAALKQKANVTQK